MPADHIRLDQRFLSPDGVLARDREAGIVEQTYYRWRKEYGGLQVDQARRLKELEQENAKLKRLVSELSLEKLVLKDIASGNF